ncbi:MAG TPA: aldose epimerase family protein [Rhizomicrobium sp.]|nr:aldose epimerase family protein [Rhizomicrobium sp.]
MHRTLYGAKQDGGAVHATTLTNANGLSATILDMGGTITAIRIPGRDGQSRNVVLGLRDLAAYETSGWWNCLIGRYANRLKNGFFLDGRHYPLTQNAHGVTLHGGRETSWGRRVWDTLSADDSALALRLISPDGDQGFPGTLTVTVIYTLTDDNALQLDYQAVTTAPTPVNLTNHIYFNLAGEGPVMRQLLMLNADHLTPTDGLQIPTGAIAPVAGTAFDFRKPKPIGADVDSSEPQMVLARGYDHNFVLNKTKSGALELAARMEDPESGRVLEVLTTEPGMQVYSTNNVKDGQVNAAGEVIRPRDGLALETQHFPDSPNKSGFPSTILRPGETFRSTTLFRFP